MDDEAAATVKKAIGKRIREARERHGLSRERLARKLPSGSSGLVLHWEEGQGSFDVQLLEAFAVALEVPYGWLRHGKNGDDAEAPSPPVSRDPLAAALDALDQRLVARDAKLDDQIEQLSRRVERLEQTDDRPPR